MSQAINCFITIDYTDKTKERKYLDLELQYRIRHLERLKHARNESVKTHEVHLELLDLMKQIIVYCANIAKTSLITIQKGGTFFR